MDILGSYEMRETWDARVGSFSVCRSAAPLGGTNEGRRILYFVKVDSFEFIICYRNLDYRTLLQSIVRSSRYRNLAVLPTAGGRLRISGRAGRLPLLGQGRSQREVSFTFFLTYI